jgi:hypothetical protein
MPRSAAPGRAGSQGGAPAKAKPEGDLASGKSSALPKPQSRPDGAGFKLRAASDRTEIDPKPEGPGSMSVGALGQPGLFSLDDERTSSDAGQDRAPPAVRDGDGAQSKGDARARAGLFGKAGVHAFSAEHSKPIPPAAPAKPAVGQEQPTDLSPRLAADEEDGDDPTALRDSSEPPALQRSDTFDDGTAVDPLMPVVMAAHDGNGHAQTVSQRPTPKVLGRKSSLPERLEEEGEGEQASQTVRELASLIFAAMPSSPRSQVHEVRFPLEGAHFPERCPGCGDRAGARVTLIFKPWRQEPIEVKVPFCRACYALAPRRMRHLAIRAAVVFVLFALSTRISGFLAGVLFVDLLRIIYAAIARKWSFGMKLTGLSEDGKIVTALVEDRGYADFLRSLNEVKLADLESEPHKDPEHPIPEVSRERLPSGLNVRVSPIVGTPDKPPERQPPMLADKAAPIELSHKGGGQDGQLDRDTASKVDRKLEDAQAHIAAQRYVQALVELEAAASLLPKPDDRWAIASKVYAAMGEAYFKLGDFKETVRCMSHALDCPEGIGDPSFLLRCGQAQLELGDMEKAKKSLTSAYLGGGADLFAGEDPKYLAIAEK